MVDRPRISRLSTKSMSLLPTVSNLAPGSTTDPTTAVNYENVNLEIQSVHVPSPSILQLEAATINSEIDITGINQLSLLPTKFHLQPLISDENTTCADIYPNSNDLGATEYRKQCIDISKSNDNVLFHQKLKHFFIFSVAGKPIYSLHGNDDLTMGYMGILTTILSTFQEDLDQDVHVIELGSNRIKLVALNRSPIVLIAISKLPHETEQFLTRQLIVLYKYLLSILSKQTIDRVFHNRLNYDLRRVLSPLDMENLDSLCMKLTFGLQHDGLISFLSELFTARPSLRIPYTLRKKMDRFLREQQEEEEDLLFAILSKDNQVTNFVHPKIHTLTNEDLYLLTFIVHSLKNKSEDLWIPLCMPNFNQNGYLYIFLRSWRQLTLILVSGSKNAFDKLKVIADRIIQRAETSQAGHFLENLEQALMKPIRNEVPLVIKHFVYVNKEINQCVISEINDDSDDLKLQLVVYYSLLKQCKSQLEADEIKNGYKKLSYMRWNSSTAFMLSGTSFEFYCVAGDGVDSKNLIEICLKIVNWCKKNKNRLFST